ncbi:hypothetical protein ACROYT_G019408 [Oculina patagonica]
MDEKDDHPGPGGRGGGTQKSRPPRTKQQGESREAKQCDREPIDGGQGAGGPREGDRRATPRGDRNLDSNVIRNLERNVFSDLATLYSLTLNSNFIRHLDQDIFSTLTSLHIL